MRPNQTDKLLHSKGKHHRNKKITTKWEEIAAKDITDKGLMA